MKATKQSYLTTLLLDQQCQMRVNSDTQRHQMNQWKKYESNIENAVLYKKKSTDRRTQ